MKLVRTTCLLVAVCALTAVAGPALARPDLGDREGPGAALEVDVAEVGGRPGAAVAGGFLYPAGTLSASNGARADGTPEFPDKVIGRWLALPGTPRTVASVGGRSRPAMHVFSLEIDGATLLAEGDDGATAAPVVAWTVMGGSGRFSAARGTARESVLGRNKARGRNLRVSFELGV